jgi:ABC-type cobalamin transport system ATPase subunit
VARRRLEIMVVYNIAVIVLSIGPSGCGCSGLRQPMIGIVPGAGRLAALDGKKSPSPIA